MIYGLGWAVAGAVFTVVGLLVALLVGDAVSDDERED